MRRKDWLVIVIFVWILKLYGLHLCKNIEILYCNEEYNFVFFTYPERYFKRSSQFNERSKVQWNYISFVWTWKSKNVTSPKLKMISHIVKMLSNQKNKKKGQVHDWMLHYICFHMDLPFYWKYQAHRSRFHRSKLLDLIRNPMVKSLKVVAAQVNCFITHEKSKTTPNIFFWKSIIDSTGQKVDLKATQWCREILRNTLVI